MLLKFCIFAFSLLAFYYVQSGSAAGTPFQRQWAKLDSEHGRLRNELKEMDTFLKGQFGMAEKLFDIIDEFDFYLELFEEKQNAFIYWEYDRNLIGAAWAAIGIIWQYKTKFNKEILNKPSEKFKMLKEKMEELEDKVSNMETFNRKERGKKNALLKRIQGSKAKLEEIEERPRPAKGDWGQEVFSEWHVLRMGEDGEKADKLLRKQLVPKLVQVGALVEENAPYMGGEDEAISRDFLRDLYQVLAKFPRLYDEFFSNNQRNKAAVEAVLNNQPPIHSRENESVKLVDLLSEIRIAGAKPMKDISEYKVAKLLDEKNNTSKKSSFLYQPNRKLEKLWKSNVEEWEDSYYSSFY